MTLAGAASDCSLPCLLAGVVGLAVMPRPIDNHGDPLAVILSSIWFFFNSVDLSL